MEPQLFIAEVYRRMSRRSSESVPFSELLREISSSRLVKDTAENFKHLLPDDKSAAILDIGFGSGWFIAAALSLGYQNISGTEYGIDSREYIYDWSQSVKKLYNVESSIGDFLKDKPQSFDFIHMSHVIEHIPKYHLIYVMDAIYHALKIGGVAFFRTPNMEGPCANSCLYVTLGHEYGFTGSNIKSLMEICNFDEVIFHNIMPSVASTKERVGSLIRKPFVEWNAIKHRLFGVNTGGNFGTEISISGKRLGREPLFDTKFR